MAKRIREGRCRLPRSRGRPPRLDRLADFGRRHLPREAIGSFRDRVGLLRDAIARSDPDLGLAERVDAYRRGFTRDLYRLYKIDAGAEPTDLLTELARRRIRYSNDAPEVLDDKAAFREHMIEAGLESYLPRLYGMVEGGSLRSVGPWPDLRTLIEREGPVVVKALVGGGGSRVYVCEPRTEGPVAIGGGGTNRELEKLLASLDRAVVTERCEQAPYLEAVNPRSANTLRLLVIDPDDADAFVAAAAQRFGTSRSGPIDNVSQGGIVAEVDVATGELSTAVEFESDRAIQWHDVHPDTGEAIRGMTIPKWGTIRNEILATQRRLPGFRYVGWDLLVTEPGEFVVIEGNSHPNVRMHQLHRPLLADPRVRRFFDR